MLLKNFFIGMSENQLLNHFAQNYGFKFGAQSVVAGTNITEMIASVKKLNNQGITCTIDNLGEFVSNKDDAIKAKNQIINVLKAVTKNNVQAHISLKPSQLGLDIDYDFCLENLREIIEIADQFDIFINFDMEDHSHLHPSFTLLNELSKDHHNIGTVIQSYFYESMDNIKQYKDFRLRIVKGAYKEPEERAYQDKKDIDDNYLKLIEYHLLNGKFTSIATHDHHVINHVKEFVKEHDIPNNKFEFQMLYGFRYDLQLQLAKEGYHFCTYVPFGTDWYGYFMRRLAERPQNINLMLRQMFNKRTNTMIGLGVGAFLLGRCSKRAVKVINNH